MNRHSHAQPPEPLRLGLSPPQPRWQPDRRSARGGRPTLERRSGVDKRRQPRTPLESRQIYPD